MSVATVAGNKGVKRPQYKDYVSFLGNYKNGKKEDQTGINAEDSGVSLSLSNSSNNSSSSVYSDLTDAPRNSFKEYLENYNSKRYSSVQPPVIIKKQGEHQDSEAKTVKTEVFLEIHSPASTVTKVVDVTNGHGVLNVSKVSKIFENGAQNDNIVAKNLPPSGKVNTFNFGQKDAETKHEQKRISVGVVPKNHHKVPLKKAHSISEKSKVFEDTNNSINEAEQPAKTNGCPSPKPLIHSTKPVFIAKAKPEDKSTPRTNGSTSPKPLGSIKPIIVPKVIAETLTFHQVEESPMTKANDAPIVNNAKLVIAPKTVIETIHLEINSPPVPPPLPPSFQQERITYSPPTCPPPPPPAAQTFQGGINAPPPPPPPPANLSTNKILYSPPKTCGSVQKVAANGGPRKHDVVDGTAAPVIDKNDPRVKKLVYGALREMYGAYHDQANDYIATLPRNRVKKNNGLDSIINSIASQGGLEKLNGRVNPTVETD